MKPKNVLRRNIAATWLKILCKNLYSVKRYDETNMKVFCISLWEIICLGLTYFNEFYIPSDKRCAYLSWKSHTGLFKNALDNTITTRLHLENKNELSHIKN